MALLSDAALPMMVLVLGMQLERATWPERPDMVDVASLLSLVATPLAAFGVARLLGPAGARRCRPACCRRRCRRPSSRQSSRSSSTSRPSFVTSVVCVTTLLSPITLTVLIAFLQHAGYADTCSREPGVGSRP